MSKDVAERYEILKSYEAGNINIKELSQILNVGKQQAYKIVKRYKQEGIKSLYHGNKNKPSNNSYDISRKLEILTLIRNKYYDCGASYASELLEEYTGIKTLPFD